MDALVGTSKKQKELIKEDKRNYLNKEHWNLDATFLNDLKNFLLKYKS